MISSSHSLGGGRGLIPSIALIQIPRRKETWAQPRSQRVALAGCTVGGRPRSTFGFLYVASSGEGALRQQRLIAEVVSAVLPGARPNPPLFVFVKLGLG